MQVLPRCLKNVHNDVEEYYDVDNDARRESCLLPRELKERRQAPKQGDRQCVAQCVRQDGCSHDHGFVELGPHYHDLEAGVVVKFLDEEKGHN